MRPIYLFIISLIYLFSIQQNVEADQRNNKNTKKKAIKTINKIDKKENNKTKLSKLLNNKYIYNHIIFSAGFNIFGSNFKIDNIPNNSFNSLQFYIGLNNNLYFKLPNDKIDLLLGVGFEYNINLKNNNVSTNIQNNVTTNIQNEQSSFINNNTSTNIQNNVTTNIQNEQSSFITDYKDRFDIIAKNQNIYKNIISQQFNNLTSNDYKDYKDYINNKYSSDNSFFDEVKEKIEQNNNDIIQLAPIEGTSKDIIGNMDWSEIYKRAKMYFSSAGNDQDIENMASIYTMLTTGFTEEEAISLANYTNDPFYKYYNNKEENTSTEFLNAFENRQKIINEQIASYTNDVKDMAKNNNYILGGTEDKVTFDNIDYSNINIDTLIENIKELQANNDNFIILKDYSANDDYVGYEEAYNNYLQNKALDLENITDEEKRQAAIYAMLKTGITEDNLKNADYTNDPFYKYDKTNDQSNDNNKTNDKSNNKDRINNQSYAAYEKLNATIKLGAKYKFNNNYSAQFYIPVGLNLLQITHTINTESKRKDKIGLTIGIGADFIIKERFLIGVLYRYGYNRYNNITFNTNVLQLKLGINLL